MMATLRLRPHEALLEQSRTVLDWLHGLTPEAFERPTVLPGWNVRSSRVTSSTSTPASGSPWMSRPRKLLCRSRSM